MKNILLFILILLFSNLNAMNIHYEVSFPVPENHYTHVNMTLTGVSQSSLVVNLPVWTPGSYLVREYAQHLQEFQAEGESGRSIGFEKIDKNSWRINSKGKSVIVIKYKLYCFDATVRTNFVDTEHATLIGANTFLYVEGSRNEPSTITFKPYKTWKSIATSLPKKGKSKWIRTAIDYDDIIDNPVELGNLTEYNFKAGGVPHRLAVSGPSNADMKKLTTDLERICNEHIKILGDNPCDEYLFILLMTENRYNGLEHKNCSLNQLPRWDFYPATKYQRSMGLLSHEYFHLWNVKRIRPVELTSIDYNKEVYTRQLWVAEGVTSYYDDYVLYKSTVVNKEEYLAMVAKMLSVL